MKCDDCLGCTAQGEKGFRGKAYCEGYVKSEEAKKEIVKRVEYRQEALYGRCKKNILQ